MRFFILTLFSLLFVPQMAMAADLGDLGVFFDAQGTQSSMELPLFGEVEIWIVAFDLEGGMAGYEFGVDIPPGLFPWFATGCFLRLPIHLKMF